MNTQEMNDLMKDLGIECLANLNIREQDALECALSLVLSDYPKSWIPELVVEATRAGICVPWQPFECFGYEDLYNIIWQFQEAIYEAMLKGDPK